MRRLEGHSLVARILFGDCRESAAKGLEEPVRVYEVR